MQTSSVSNSSSIFIKPSSPVGVGYLEKEVVESLICHFFNSFFENKKELADLADRVVTLYSCVRFPDNPLQLSPIFYQSVVQMITDSALNFVKLPDKRAAILERTSAMGKFASFLTSLKKSNVEAKIVFENQSFLADFPIPLSLDFSKEERFHAANELSEEVFSHNNRLFAHALLEIWQELRSQEIPFVVTHLNLKELAVSPSFLAEIENVDHAIAIARNCLGIVLDSGGMAIDGIQWSVCVILIRKSQ